MSAYRYLFYDLMSNVILGEFNLTGVTFDQRLNAPGSLNGNVSISDPKVQGADPLTATQPGRTAVYAERDGVLLWGGIVWTRRYQESTQTLQLGAKEFLSYFGQRLIMRDYARTQTDQFSVVADLVNTAQATAGGNVGVSVPNLKSGVGIDVTYYGYEYRNLLQELTTLSQAVNGFDFAVDVGYVNGVPTKSLTLSYPRRGVPWDQSLLQWELPGNISELIWPEDATLMADVLVGLGAGSAATMLQSPIPYTAAIDAGWPLLEQTLSLKTVQTQSQLDAVTRGHLMAMQQPVVLPQVTVSASAEPALGTYRVGDEARFRLTGSRFAGPAYPAGLLDMVLRITAVQVTPPGDGTAEQVVLTLGFAI